jgi:hypothetical protein
VAVNSEAETKRQTVLDDVPDAFFVCLLQCNVALERFEDVALVDDAFELTDRRSEANAALAAVLRDPQRLTTKG